ncbi:MAG: flagellar hook-basal body complex protein FliE [Vampirovibrionales bacterium]|nr:flagellar hook-basal body complex protein FliE [Vampirovibrionales bacterium]
MLDNIGGNMLNAQISLGQTQGKGLGKAAKPDEENPSGSALQSFGDVLKEQLNQVNNLQNVADDAAETYALGGDIELHNVILATEKAELSLQFATQVRNKLLSAYQEIYKMPI